MISIEYSSRTILIYKSEHKTLKLNIIRANIDLVIPDIVI